MLDIRFVREHADAVKADLEKRRIEGATDVDAVLAKDEEWRKLKQQSDTLRAKRNALSQRINEVKKQGGDVQALLKEVKEVPEKIRQVDEQATRFQSEIREMLMRLPNIMDSAVPLGVDETDNTVVKTFEKKPSFDFEPKNHTELIEALNVVELERAAKIAGSRHYFLQGDLALLDHALQNYALSFMAARGYTLVVPPHMLNRAAYEGVVDLGDFEDVIFKVQDEDLYLIATSEHPLTAQFKDEVLDESSLPIKLAGISPCYRKETGSHGKEEKGIWRVHTFNKVEQIVICTPEESETFHEELTQNAIAFFRSLGLHFRQVLMCTGDLGTIAAKKYDLEAWIPSVQAYKEVVSSSNCTAYQAVRLNIRYRKQNETAWVHTLNATCVATSRALVAILEQNQQKDGSIVIPKPLRPYLGGKEKIAPVPKI